MCLTTGFRFTAKFTILSFIFSIILWGLCNICNKMGIEKKLPKTSNEVFQKLLFLQKWHLLLQVGDARFLDEKIKIMKI